MSTQPVRTPKVHLLVLASPDTVAMALTVLVGFLFQNNDIAIEIKLICLESAEKCLKTVVGSR